MALAPHDFIKQPAKIPTKILSEMVTFSFFVVWPGLNEVKIDAISPLVLAPKLIFPLFRRATFSKSPFTHNLRHFHQEYRIKNFRDNYCHLDLLRRYVHYEKEKKCRISPG